jgi:hypothetical protein
MGQFDWTGAVRRAFVEEIEELGGKVTEWVEAEGEVFARSTLPGDLEVGPRDRVRGGVALRGSPESLRIRPYVFRLVCRNGAIMACCLEATVLERPGWCDPGALEIDAREAVKACASRDTFEGSRDRMSALRMEEAAGELMAIAFMATHGATNRALQGVILRRFRAGRDRSQFGFMNAVTSVARDTREAALRWDLEELGGAIACGMPTPRRAQRKRAPSMALV